MTSKPSISIAATGSDTLADEPKTVRASRRVRPWRAAGRLIATTAHLLHGAAICAFVFPTLADEARRARIVAWSATLLALLGVRLEVRGALRPGPVLLLANHVSWLDIVAVQAIVAARFVSKADVRRWPLIGYLAASAGTIFIARENRRDASRAVDAIAEILRRAGTAVVFPEGTTSDGRLVLPFRAGLVEAAVTAAAPVQPVAIRFSEPHDAFGAAAAFVGTTTLVASLWRIACADGLVARVTLLPTIDGSCADRRAIATRARAQIRSVLDAQGRSGP